jgi:hypothetical protein
VAKANPFLSGEDFLHSEGSRDSHSSVVGGEVCCFSYLLTQSELFYDRIKVLILIVLHVLEFVGTSSVLIFVRTNSTSINFLLFY